MVMAMDGMAPSGMPRPIASRVIAAAVCAYVDRSYAFNTHRATWDGWHGRDGQAPDFSPAAYAARLRELAGWGGRLPTLRMLLDSAATGEPVAPERLRTDRMELAILESARREEVFRIERWRRHETDPRTHYGALDVSVYVTRAFAHPRQRLLALTRYLHGIPDLLRGLRAHLVAPLAPLLRNCAIAAYRQLVSYYVGDLARAGAALAETDRERESFHTALDGATVALRDFVSALEASPLGAESDFRLGEERLRGLILSSEQIDLPLADLHRLGIEDLRRNTARAAAAAARMGLSLQAAFAALDRPMPEAADSLGLAARLLNELREAVAASGLVPPQPEGDICEVHPMPAHLSAGSALFEGSGVFDSPGMPARLYLPIPRVNESFNARRELLARFAPWALRNTIAHEVVPGHHRHWAHLARVQSLAARAFPSLASVEGWAHYAEELALGLGGVASDPRYELAHIRMALLRDCRFLMALELHAGDISPEDATAVFIRWTGFPPERARLETQRVMSDPCCLAYVLGKRQLHRLRDDFAQQEGARYTPRRFHDALFAQGALPLPLLRQALLHSHGDAQPNDAQWDDA